MPLFHFGEDPRIERFTPCVPPSAPGARAAASEPLVWAIDAEYAPLYYFPRDCPRIVVWALPESSAADRQRCLGVSSARMVAHIERRWFEPLCSTPVYRYEMPAEPFESLDDAGMHVS